MQFKMTELLLFLITFDCFSTHCNILYKGQLTICNLQDIKHIAASIKRLES